MGVLFLCDEYEYSCSYGNWNKFRFEIYNATMLYLEHKKNEIHLNNSDNSLSYEYNNICKILFKQKDIKNIDSFIREFKENDHYMKDLLIYFEVYGIYSLLNKSDCEGFYSIGNALDILLLIKKIKKYILDENIKSRLSGIIKLFKTSVYKMEKIVIM